MALRKNLAHRFLSLRRTTMAETLAGRSKAAAPSRSLVHKLLNSPAPSEQGFLRRMLFQSRSIFESTSSSPVPMERLSLPLGEKLMEKLRSINGDRIRLDVIHPLTPVPPDREQQAPAEKVAPMSVEEARKVLRLSRTEAVKAALRATGRSSISHSEFLRICCEGSSDREQGLGLAKALDESGAVLVLGNVVFLQPDQVAKAIEKVFPLPLLAPEDDPRRKELREMERRKADIDRRADAAVRRELWCGLGFLVAQTAGFMRLTFWELSWDVMEPICFYVSSVYFMAGYAFFLRTARDPSFEGFFESRFAAKQRRLMRAAHFDLHRFNELRRVFHPTAPSLPYPTLPPLEFSSPRASHQSSMSSSSSSSSSCDCQHHYRRDTLIGAVNY
ncbi:hypothetical protein Taro_026754 [Colocasia esculenta]|uniref:Calcium uniporter protein C-terminal domain-containing protein n=1 Tax=Colocasia esculenta TaxID=4460 RepID=A0A843VPK0_COLES|nr:hypothetical protein [Colocasia esculenta]